MQDRELKGGSRKAFAAVFSIFANSWWQKADNVKTASVLTIPKKDLPAEARHFLLGCIPKKPASDLQGKEDTDVHKAASGGAAGHSACNVLVTVKAASSSTSAAAL
ncbi:SAG-related sequence [Besnoitia besnoiti]|uniref:SAG-related sequence n=1 Tax=Besnoitia besnoiti TaxID=94643 RepID=A0A2A9MKM4_BESBE|nr:SAG-related sequence [Besnoitia besnoiti]PFH36177.1 SAG-related sequence [Besnoitia besnoiti]